MAYDEFLADRIRMYLKETSTAFGELRMMGGLCFMVDDKMLCGVLKDKKSGDDLLMARIGDADQKELKKPECLAMDFTGRPMKGYVFIRPEGFDLDEDLHYWVDLCLVFNPFAKSSKKKSKK